MTMHKSKIDPVTQMQELMDAEIANMQFGTEDAHSPTLADFFRREASQILDVLSEIQTVSGVTASTAKSLIDRCQKTGLSNSTYSHIRDYWYQFAAAVFKLEQLLWTYCDECWFDRDAMITEFTSLKNMEEDAVQVKVLSDLVLIRMPFIPATKKKHFSLAENMLWTHLVNRSDLPQWKSCHATFCHVYPTSVSQIPKDVDNYDYKRTIDTLSFNFGFSDCPESFSVSMESLLSDELPSGTYILLEPNLPKKFGNLIKSHSLFGF